MIKKILLIIAIASSSLSFGQKIAAGGVSNYIICGDSVRSFGLNVYGQLGHGNTQNLSLPKTIAGLDSVIDVSSSGVTALFLKSNGTVWACGNNEYGQLGLGNTNNVSAPVQIPGLSNIIAISAGPFHSLFLKSDSTVLACGINAEGECGLGSSINGTLTPTQIPGLNKITAISAGILHSLFLHKSTFVYACGYNDDGQLGDGTTINRYSPVLASAFLVKAISAGGDYSLFLTTIGTVYGCGNNIFGQLGIGSNKYIKTPTKMPNLDSVQQISAGFSQSLFLKTNGSIWTCGENLLSGSQGIDGSSEYLNIPTKIIGLNNVISIAAGKTFFISVHSSIYTSSSPLIKKNDGTIWGSGGNQYGQLGIGENGNHYYYPKQIVNPCAPPTPPQATMNMDGNGGTAATVCEGSNVNITSTTVGSNPDLQLVLDNSISLNNPIAIDKNSHAVFVLNNNNSVIAYNFDGTVYKTYPNLTLNNIWAFTVDENDTLYINNGSVDGSGYLQIHKCDPTGALISSIPNAYLGSSNLITDLLYYNKPGSLENLFFSDTLNGQHAINNMNMNDNNAFANSGAIYIYNRKYTSLSMDNFYADKRLLMADPINHILASTQMFNNGTSIEDTLIDPALTAGMALDYIYADTLINPDAAVMMVSSRTTGIVGLASSNLAPDGSMISQIDTSFTSMFNAVSPVGGVLVKKGNLTEYWVADNGQNKLLRLSFYNYNITPTLPAGLSFNAVKGVIEGTPKVITAPQTYTLSIYYGLGGFGSSTSTFTLGVTPSGGVSNTTGTANSNANQTDGTIKNYIDDQNCTQLVVITDFVGGTSPGYTNVEQTVDASGSVSVGNSNFVRRVTKIEAEQTESINAEIKFFYTYQDVQAFNTAHPSDALSNDTNAVTNPSRTMITTMLHMHETFDTTNSVWRNVPTFYQNMFASWKPTQQVWELNVPVTKFSEFYLGNPNVATGFNCSNSAKDTIVANDYYVWNYPDSLFASGDYVDTLINHTGCDSIVQLHLTINITTGLNEAALASGISVYPNPSNGVFNIRFNNTAIMPSKVRVISVLGTEVMNKTITSSDSIDLSPYESGIYFLSIENEGATKTWRIVKQN